MNAYASPYSAQETVATISPSRSVARNEPGSAARNRCSSSSPGFQPSPSAQATAVWAARALVDAGSPEPARIELVMKDGSGAGGSPAFPRGCPAIQERVPPPVVADCPLYAPTSLQEPRSLRLACLKDDG